MALQFFDFTKLNKRFQLDKETGQVSEVQAIPMGQSSVRFEREEEPLKAIQGFSSTPVQLIPQTPPQTVQGAQGGIQVPLQPQTLATGQVNAPQGFPQTQPQPLPQPQQPIIPQQQAVPQIPQKPLSFDQQVQNIRGGITRAQELLTKARQQREAETIRATQPQIQQLQVPEIQQPIQPQPVVQQPTPQEQAFTTLLSQFGKGIQEFQTSFKTNPITSVKTLMTDIFNQTKVPAISDKIGFITKEIEELENKRDEELENVNENPWIVEGIRRERTNKIQDKYDKKINARVNRLRLYEGVMDDARQQAQFAASLAFQVSGQQQQLQQNQLKTLLDQAEALTKAQLESRKGFELGAGETRFEFDKITGTFKEIARGIPKEIDKDIQTFTDELGTVTAIDKKTGTVLYKVPGISARPSAFVVTPQEQARDEANLRKEFNQLPLVKDFNDITKSNNQITSAYNEALQVRQQGKPVAPADQVLITAFNKMIDPQSVVREGEYARTTTGQSVINRLSGITQRAITGGAGLADADRQAIKETSDRLYNDYLKLYRQQENFYKEIAGQSNLNPERVIRPITSITPQETPENNQIEKEIEVLKSQGLIIQSAPQQESLINRFINFFTK